MPDREHPDPMQSFDDDSPRPVPEDIKIRWRGLLSLLVFVLLLAVVSRAFGPFAASVFVVVVLLGLAAVAIMGRRGYLGDGGDAWFGGGAGGDVDCGGFDGGGGGGDC